VTDPTTSPPPTPSAPGPTPAPPAPPPPSNGTPRWTVAPSAKQVELRDRRAEVVFTVGNVQVAPDRAVLEVIAGDGTARSWYVLEGERQRTVVNNQTTSYKVTIEAPLGTAVGAYWMQAQVYSADIAPEESSAFSDRVSFTVAQPTEAPHRPFPWWLVVAGAAAALVLVVATVLFVRKRGPELADVPPVSGKTVPEAENVLRGAGLSAGAKRAVNRVFPAGRVVGSEPATGAQVERSAPVDLLVSNGKGLIDTVVGPNSLAGLVAPAGLAVDGEGIIYAADYGANRVLRIDPRAADGQRAEVLVAGGPVLRARAVAPDGQGGLFIADEGGRIWRYDLGSKQLSSFAGVGNVAGPFQDGGPASSAILAGPSDVQVGPDGDVYVASRARHAIYVIGDDNRVRQLPEPATGIHLSDPSSLAFGPDGALYVTEPHAQHVIKRVGDNWVRVAGTGAAGTDGDGLPATSSRLDNPDDLAFDAFGDLYITDWGNNRVRVVTPDGTMSTAAGRELAGFDGDNRMEAGKALLKLAGTTSSGIAIDPDGHLYLSDVQNRRIRSIT
jgi:sugar lactone lactonase YvrE